MKENELEEAICTYKRNIQECITKKRMYELEKILNSLCLSLESDPDSLKIYHALRLSIVHGQICLTKFFQWKNATRERNESKTRQHFRLAILKDAIDEVNSSEKNEKLESKEQVDLS